MIKEVQWFKHLFQEK